jgi:hypothetical protein
MGEAIRIVFPAHAEQLLKMSAKFTLYGTWLKGAWGGLLGRSKQEREAVIKEKRREIFGTDAQKIWPEDLRQRL